MNKKLETVGAKRRGGALSPRCNKYFDRLQHLAGFGVAHLLVIAVTLMFSSLALAQGSKTGRTKVSPQKVGSRDTAGATIRAQRITVKPGYEAKLTSANRIVVAKKNGGGIIVEATCSCLKATTEGKRSCYVSITGDDLVCVAVDCADCGWKNVIINKAASIRQ